MCRCSRLLGLTVVAATQGYNGTESTDGPVAPSEALAFEMATKTLEFLQASGVSPDTIVLYGKSLGSGSACHLAKYCAKNNIPVAGLILHSPILSAVRVVMRTPFTLPMDIMANVDRIRCVKTLTTIVHGTEDEVVDVSHGRKLFELIPSEFVEVF